MSEIEQSSLPLGSLASAGIFARFFHFIATWRSLPPYELWSYPLMFAAAPMLAAGSRRYDAALLQIILASVVCGYAGFFVALIVNDVADADIDAVVHPDRPIPAGRVTKQKFLLIAACLIAVMLAAAWLVSPWILALAAGTSVVVIIHDRFLKRSFPIPAYSEIFTPLQWVVLGLYAYMAIWARLPSEREWSLEHPWLGSMSGSMSEVWKMVLLVAFIYFTDAAHDLPEGIVDAEGDRRAGVRTYATSFGETVAARVALSWFLLSGVLGIALFLVTSLSYLFLFGFIALFAFTGVEYVRLVRIRDALARREQSRIVGRKGFDHFLMVFNLMFVDLFVQLVVRYVRDSQV